MGGCITSVGGSSSSTADLPEDNEQVELLDHEEEMSSSEMSDNEPSLASLTSEIRIMTIPDDVSFAQSIVDYNSHCIYLVGAGLNPHIFIFDNKAQTYINNDSIIPNYDMIDNQPRRHCVTPLFDANNRLQSMLSFGGDRDHFSILERCDQDSNGSVSRFEWNNNPLSDRAMPPIFGMHARAVNINNNIHIIGGTKLANRHLVYNSKRKRLYEYPKMETVNLIDSHGLIRYKNRIVAFGGCQNNQCSDSIHYIDLSPTQMNGRHSKFDNRHRWHTSNHRMPHQMRHFGFVSIEGTPLALIVGGDRQWPCDPFDTIYIFNIESLSKDNSSDQSCFTLSKQILPKPLSAVSCVINNGQLHIIGGNDDRELRINTHYIIDLNLILSYFKISEFELVIDYWIRKGRMGVFIPSVLISLFRQFCDSFWFN